MGFALAGNANTYSIGFPNAGCANPAGGLVPGAVAGAGNWVANPQYVFGRVGATSCSAAPDLVANANQVGAFIATATGAAKSGVTGGSAAMAVVRTGAGPGVAACNQQNNNCQDTWAIDELNRLVHTTDGTF